LSRAYSIAMAVGCMNSDRLVAGDAV